METTFVQKLRSLAYLDATDVAALTAAMAPPTEIERECDLVREGDAPGPLLVVLEGWACRYKMLHAGTRQITALLLLGDSCSLHAGVLTALDSSIRTLTPCRVTRIERVTIDRLLVDHQNIARALHIAQLVDEATLRAWVVGIGRRSATARFAHLMCELFLRAQCVGLTRDNRLLLPLTQIALADVLGLTPVHLNRVLKVLKTEGAMTLQRGSLSIADPRRLAEVAGFDSSYLHRAPPSTLARPG